MLSPKLQQTYQFIKRFILQRGIAPTEKEIAQGIGIKSRGVVHRYIHGLVDAGLVKVTPRRKRNIQLVESPTLVYSQLPVIGQIAAGAPIELIQHDEKLDLTNLLLGANRFVLRLTDHCLNDDSFRSGDYLICERRNHVQPDELAVVLVNNKQIKLKRLIYNSDQSLTLLPPEQDDNAENYLLTDVKVEGIYLGMIRFKEDLN